MSRLEDADGIMESEECCWDVFTEEVLPRLPTKDLLTFKSVCKKWSRIISTPYFVGLHLNLYNRTRILVQTYDYSKMIEYNYYYEEAKHVPIPPPIPKKTKILGSCDGLLCLLIKKENEIYSIAMYNPSTGRYSMVQHSPVRFCWLSWFGHHPSGSGEYVLVLPDFTNYEKVSIYKFVLGTRLAKLHSTIHPPYSYDGIGTFLHGAVHWPAVNYDAWPSCGIIIAYHIEDNKFREISGPRGVKSCFKLGVNAEGCLFAIVVPMESGEFEMWIMKEYGVEKSWAKYGSIGIDNDGFRVNNIPSPLGFFPNGDLILDVNNLKLMRYNFNDRKIVLLMNHNYSRQVIMCADTLVSPAIGK